MKFYTVPRNLRDVRVIMLQDTYFWRTRSDAKGFIQDCLSPSHADTMAIHEVHFKCHNIELSPSPIFFWLLLYLPMRLGLIWWLIFCLNCVLQKVWENALKFHRSIWIRFGSSLFFFVFLQRNQCWSKKKVVSLCCSSSFFIAMLLSSGELKKVVFPCCSSFQSSKVALVILRK